MKTVTGTGDRGRTGLLSGERVSKAHVRVEACGDVDELNAILGVLVAFISRDRKQFHKEIRTIQSDLFHLGAWLASTSDDPVLAELEKTTQDKISALEAAIDRMEQGLPDLRGFVLPGGGIAAAWSHLARTACRRAERHVVRLMETFENGEAPVPLQETVIYLNRLSDYLFVLARLCNHVEGLSEIHWRR